ncbi:MAG: acetyl-CoA carboxylase carboxyltransferase subunit alpha [Deltaproteobacteria bacterium]|nr:acetyl-CoA carboxylase carboxyltransferase subunit alpha [Deltaproteobacteria bacterium]
MDYIPFERPLADLEIRIQELRRLASTQAINLNFEIGELETQALSLRNTMFSKLTPYEITQVSRHPKRPNTKEIIGHICSSFIELHGDRNFFDDPAIVGGLGKLENHSAVLIGHQKGRGTKDNIARNFGMSRPEGYRKALRLMSLAERFHLPIITFIDTPGAYPGIGAEERGQSEAIGKNIMVMSRLKVPIICIVLGEGGSGGALALGIGNRVHMLQYSIYSVISPEGCASILLKDPSQADAMANALQLTASSALKLKAIDSIIEEPQGGAHRSPEQTAANIKKVLLNDLSALSPLSGEELSTHRMNKFLNMGAFEEGIA